MRTSGEGRRRRILDRYAAVRERGRAGDGKDAHQSRAVSVVLVVSQLPTKGKGEREERRGVSEEVRACTSI